MAFYNPTQFRVEDPETLRVLVEKFRFGTLVSNGPTAPHASHLPFLMDPGVGPSGTLMTHLARANDHWRGLVNEPVLVILQGPQHYVSPSWYASKRTSGKVVPTWNYVVVHIRGTATTFDDSERLLALVETLTDTMERERKPPWRVADAPADYIDTLLTHIVGVAIEIEHMEAKLKLGQNRSQADQDSLKAALIAENPGLAEALDGLPLSGV